MKQRTMADHNQSLLNRIRNTLHDSEPTARIILYGSRARGDAHPDADWDLLILLDGAVDCHRAAAIHHRLYQLELETEAVLSAIVLSQEEWDSPLSCDAVPRERHQRGPGAMSAQRDILIRSRMERARETLVEADLMAPSGHWNGCVNRLYYACFSAVTALLLKQDHYCSVKAHDSAAWHGETSLSRY